MAVVSIPLNSSVNTRDDYIITDIETEQKDILSKKNSLVFKNVLSPFYKKEENKVFTTAGHIIKKINDTTFEDEKGRQFSVDNSLVVDFSADITNLWSGELTSAICRADKIYSAWKSEKEYTLVVSDLDNKVLEYHNYPIDTTDLLYYNVKFANYTKTASESTTEIYLAVQKVYSTPISEISLYTVENTTQTTVWNESFNYLTGKDLYILAYYNSSVKVAIGTDDIDIRKRFTFVNGTILYKYFGCLGSNALLTGEPIYLPVSASSGKISIANPTFVNFSYLANGQSYTPTYADSYSDTDTAWNSANNSLVTTPITDNTATTWGSVNHTRSVWKAYIGGFDLEQNIPLVISASLSNQADDFPNGTNQKGCQIIPIKDTYYSLPGDIVKNGNKNCVGFEQVDFSNGLGIVKWESAGDATIENGCNSFPYRYSISNRADAKNVYWTYGPGFVRSYVRECTVGQVAATTVRRVCYERFPAAIVSYGLNPAEYTENCVRIEPLTPVHTNGSPLDLANNATGNANFTTITEKGEWYLYNTIYRRCHKCDNSNHSWIDFIGVDNLGNKTILNILPYQVAIIPELKILDQYYGGIYMSTSMEGTLLISASQTLNSNSQIYCEDSNTASLFSNGMILKGVRNGNVIISKIADYMYKTNSLKGNNLFIDSKENFKGQRAFISYNGEEVIDVSELTAFYTKTDISTVEANDIYYTATGYNQAMNNMAIRGISYLLPPATISLSLDSSLSTDFDYQLMDNKKSITKPLLINSFTYKDEPADHYYTHSNKSTAVVYQASNKLESYTTDEKIKRYGIPTFDADKSGFVWDMSSTVLYYPLGIASEISGINYLTSTVNMTDNYTVRLLQKETAAFPAYNPTTEVYKGSTIFTIYGYNYSFDGQAIYYLGSGSDTSQLTFSCYALGMQFLANSGTEAYFYSPFEKRIYLFTGSVTLQMSDSLAREGKIIDSIYSSNEQILYLLTDEGNIICKSQDDMCMIQNIDTDYHFEGTDSGVILVKENKYLKFRLYQTDEDDIIPLEFETEYIGKNNSLYKSGLLNITFFSTTKKSISGKVYFETVYDTEAKRTEQDWKITTKDFDSINLYKMTVAIPNNVGKAFKIGISSSDYISIADIGIEYNKVSENTNAPKHK